MGIAAPLYGYVIPSRSYAKGETISPIAQERSVAEIEEFCREIKQISIHSILERMKYPSNQKIHLDSIKVETDLLKRTVLRQLITNMESGSIIVHYRSDLYVQGTGACSTKEQREHASLLNGVIDGMIPVISLRETREEPKIPLIRSSMRIKNERVYFIIADNYADNRKNIESHVKKVMAKPHANPEV